MKPSSPGEAFLQVVFTGISSGDSGQYKCAMKITDYVDMVTGMYWETTKNVTVTDTDTTPSPRTGPNPESQTEVLDSGVIVLLVAIVILATFIPATWLISKRWKRSVISKEDAMPLDDTEKESRSVCTYKLKKNTRNH